MVAFVQWRRMRYDKKQVFTSINLCTDAPLPEKKSGRGSLSPQFFPRGRECLYTG